MSKHEDRYQAWSDTAFQSWADGNSDIQEFLWAEDATRLSIHPFDESDTTRGRSAIMERFNQWKVSDAKMLKNEILSSGPDYGIGNARAEWQEKDGKIWACDWIYKITLDSNDQCTSYQEWNVVHSKEAE